MGKFAQLVVGPAGCGKSTYCHYIKQHCDTLGRPVHCVNLDPAAEEFKYPVSTDIRELITLEDVMEELELGPNGGLLYCMEYLEENLEEWLGDELEPYIDDDYLLFDCPGQIELYSHATTFKTFVDYLKRNGWYVCAVYCIDCQFIMDTPKFISGCLQALSAMVQLELPHVNVITKVDMLGPEKALLDDFLFPESRDLACRLDATTGSRFTTLNKAVADLLDEYGMVSFLPLDISDEDSLQYVLSTIDVAIQYGEDTEPRIPRDPEEGDESNHIDHGNVDL